MNDARYYSLNTYLRQTFGEKVYRLSLNGGMTCPNRDGSIGTGGCIFCSAGGSGDFAASPQQSVTGQIAQAKLLLREKTNCRKYIAYFQAYTNTYAPVGVLRALYTEALAQPDIVALSIATRCDCLPPDVLDLLAELNTIKPVWVELGLQTIHEHTLRFIRSGFSLAQYEQAVSALHARGIKVITHLILGLPGETTDDMRASVRYLAAHPVFGVKLQLLHVLEGTDLGTLYKNDPFPLFTLEEYCDLIADCLALLPPEMVIHRLTGDGPRRLLLAPQWSTDKKRVLNMLDKVDFPLTNTQISDFFLEQEYTDYFRVQQVLNDLADSGLIRTESTHSNTQYYITAAGRETLGFFRDKLTDAIEHDTIAYFEKNKMALRTVNSIIADYYKTPNQDYAVRCQFRVHDTNLIDLTLTVKNKEQAEAICNNWKKQNEDVYAYLMDILMQ